MGKIESVLKKAKKEIKENQKNILYSAIAGGLTGIVLFSCLGCKTIPKREYLVTEPFTICLMDKKEFDKEMQIEGGSEGIIIKRTKGYCKMGSRELYIPYTGKKDVNGEYLPDFETLGHELWHLPELGERFHGDSEGNKPYRIRKLKEGDALKKIGNNYVVIRSSK